MNLVSKWFRVATAGSTVDGREIKESWLNDIAETYDKEEYTSSIFKDHLRFLGGHGIVHSVKTGRDKKDRLCLYARVQPNNRLIELNKNGEALFSSISILEDFAGTGKAYLDHLAVTDTPASLGTQLLSFSKQEGVVVTEFIETELSFSAETEITEEERGLLKRFFNKQKKEDNDMSKEQLEAIQSTLQEFGQKIEQLGAKYQGSSDDNDDGDATQFSQQLSDISDRLGRLETQFSQEQSGDDAPGLDELKTQFQSLQDQLNAALQEQPGTQTGPQEGAGNAEFSIY